MTAEKLAMLVSLLVALSMASERLVEIIKGLIPFLDRVQADATMEGRRRAALQALAAVAGVVTAALAMPMMPTDVSSATTPVGMVALGLLASGGSGFWNSLQGYVSNAKELKKTTVAREGEALGVVAGAHRDLDLGAEQVTSNECYDVEDR